MINLQLEIQKAIAKHKYSYPYSQTKDKKSYLKIWLIHPEKAAEEVMNLLKNNNIIDE